MGRGRGAPRRAAGAALGAVVGAGCLAAALGAPGVAAGAQSTATLGIGTSWTTSAGTWASFPMGHLRTASNTFWELMFRPAGSTRWALVTPPGVASNGGLVGASTSGAGTTVVVGFLPAKYLRYSPVARTDDGGKKWTTGTLPAGLAPVADALATGTAGQVLALERAQGGTLVHSAGSLTTWAPVTTGHALAATSAGAACGLRDISAVTVGSAGTEVGADCTKPGVVGLFADSSGSWQADGPTLPGEAGAVMRVLRLVTTPAGTAALVEATPSGSKGSKGSGSLVALWRPNGQAWTASAPAHVDGQVRAASIGPQLSVTVVTAARSGAEQVHATGGPGSTWTTTTAPRGTQAVTPGPAGAVSAAAGDLSALAVSGSSVTVWSRSGGPWRKTVGFKVPIEYGSST